jgi:hypothetical protein
MEPWSRRARRATAGAAGPGGRSGTAAAACAAVSGQVDSRLSDAAEGRGAEGGSSSRGGWCRAERARLRTRERAFRERATAAWRAVEARAAGPATQRGTTCHCGHGRHGAGHGRRRVTAPGHGGHGDGHGNTSGDHGAGHSDHGDGERPAGPVPAAASAAGAAASTIPFQGLEVENNLPPKLWCDHGPRASTNTVPRLCSLVQQRGHDEQKSVYLVAHAERKGLERFKNASGRREVHVRAGRKSLTMAALKVQDLLINMPRLLQRCRPSVPRCPKSW